MSSKANLVVFGILSFGILFFVSLSISSYYVLADPPSAPSVPGDPGMIFANETGNDDTGNSSNSTDQNSTNETDDSDSGSDHSGDSGSSGSTHHLHRSETLDVAGQSNLSGQTENQTNGSKIIIYYVDMTGSGPADQNMALISQDASAETSSPQTESQTPTIQAQYLSADQNDISIDTSDYTSASSLTSAPAVLTKITTQKDDPLIISGILLFVLALVLLFRKTW